MSGEDSSADPDSATEPLYATRFREHLADVQAHLAGLDGDDLLPSYIPPTGYWTPSEKNTFFHSLGVYSRFRPDMVAACIGTKTVVDVCAYIDALDSALSRDRHLLPPRCGLEGAMEVSTAWARQEEQMAEELSSLEPEWEARIVLLQREEEVSAFPTSAPTEEVSSSNGHETWESDRRRRWAQEDALSQLDCHHLRVMEGILKEAESGDPNVEDALPEDQHAETTAAHMPLPHPEKPSDQTSHLSVVGDGMVIDPILLRHSGLPAPDQPLQNNVPPRQSLFLPRDVPNPFEPGPPCNPASSPLSSHVPAFPQASSCPRAPSPESDRELAQDPSDLSPVSRRRFQKRLYMRRKRAALRGEEASAGIAKLRPGRKVAERKTPKSTRRSCTNEPEPTQGEDVLMDLDQDTVAVTRPSGSTQVEKASQEDGSGSDDESRPRKRKRNKGGLTRYYKIKKAFALKGIDADNLVDNDLGVFHLSTLSRLMTLYKSGFDTTKSSDAVTAISADTIRLLTAILVEFTTEVVQRTLISREQENSMKGGIKVYHHLRDEISVDNVSHVLEMMGMRGLTKRQYFAELLGEDMPETDEEQVPTDDEGVPEGEVGGEDGEGGDDGHDSEDVDSDDSTDDDDGSPHPEQTRVFPDLLPLHREIHPPLIHLPKSLFPHNSASAGAATITNDVLMPDTDEEKLLEELEDEIELDETDQVAAKAYEADLWTEFGKRS